jgi:hypothetical protein
MPAFLQVRLPPVVLQVRAHDHARETLTPGRRTAYGRSVAKCGRATDGVTCASAECWEGSRQSSEAS